MLVPREKSYYLIRHKCSSILTVDLIKMASQVSIFVVAPVHVCCLEEKYLFTDYPLPCQIQLESASQAVLFPHLSEPVNSLKLCKPPLQSLYCLPLGGTAITIKRIVSPNMFISFSFHSYLWLTDFANLPTNSNLVLLCTALHCVFFAVFFAPVICKTEEKPAPSLSACQPCCSSTGEILARWGCRHGSELARGTTAG